MTLKHNLENRIKGWFPQEPLNSDKPLQLRLETNPLKLKRINGKVAINVAQLVAVVLALGLILGGLQLNSVSTTKGSYSLPINSTTYHNLIQVDGNTYNCSIYLFISPPLQESTLGTANHVNPLYVYLKDPKNITSGSYIVTLKYARYNDTLNAYLPEEFNQTGTFSANQVKKPALLFSVIALSPPFEPGPASLQPIVSEVVFGLYCNATNAGAGSFTIETPINGAQSGHIITYPYGNIGNILLGTGILCLLLVLTLTIINVGRKSRSYPTQSYQKELTA